MAWQGIVIHPVPSVARQNDPGLRHFHVCSLKIGSTIMIRGNETKDGVMASSAVPDCGSDWV